MTACLRSTRFMFPDRSAAVFLELRRRHDTKSETGDKCFVVTKRTTFATKTILNKSFGTYNEARRHWDDEALILADSGLIRDDFKIVGFHEEG